MEFGFKIDVQNRHSIIRIFLNSTIYLLWRIFYDDRIIYDEEPVNGWFCEPVAWNPSGAVRRLTLSQLGPNELAYQSVSRDIETKQERKKQKKPGNNKWMTSATIPK